MMTNDQFRANVRKELDQGWAGLKILAGCPGAIAEARETAEYVRARLHPVASIVAVRGRKRFREATAARAMAAKMSPIAEAAERKLQAVLNSPSWDTEEE